MWRNWSLHTLLVGMQNGAAALEISVVASQNGKHRTPHKLNDVYA